VNTIYLDQCVKLILLLYISRIRPSGPYRFIINSQMINPWTYFRRTPWTWYRPFAWRLPTQDLAASIFRLASSSKTSVSYHITARRHNHGDLDLNLHRRWNLNPPNLQI